MADNSEKRVAITGFMWRFLERWGAQGVTMIVSIILARLLDPSVYGTISLVTIFTTILNIFIDSGMSSGLIQKKDADDLDFSSLFYFNIVMCIVLYTGMFFCAPLIADFYGVPELTPLTRVISLTLIISGVKGVQVAYVSRNKLFKRFFFATLGGTIGAAVIGITMAYLGFGPWALVTQSLFNNIVDTIILWATVKWRPKWMFSFSRLKRLFGFGWKILLSGLIDTGYNNLRQLIIGKIYSTSDLAFFNKGSSWPSLFVTNINSAIDSVLFPIMSDVQDNLERIKSMTRRAIRISTYILFPVMMGLAVCAEPLISIVLTDKWLPEVPYLRIFCFSYAFWPVHTANLNAIKAMGRSDYFLVLEIIKKVISIVLIIVTMRISVLALASTLIVTTILSQIINAWPNKKLLNYSYLQQLKDMLPSLALTIFMGICCYSITIIKINVYLTLFIQIIVGIVVYVGGSKLFKFESYNYVLSTIKEFRKSKKKTAKNND